jgi:hypothetical protein
VWSEFYTDEEIDAMGDALVREDVVEAARRLRAYHARQRATADRAQPPAQHSPVAVAEPERSAGPPTDQAEAATETGWEMPVQRRGDARSAQAALADGTAATVRPDDVAAGLAESRDHTGRATQPGGVDEFEGVPEARPQEVTVSVAQAARRLVAAGHDPVRARALVADYVQDTSRQLGLSTAGWGLDQHDLDAIEASTDPPSAQRDRDVHSHEGERARPHRDPPERDPLDRARNAVAELPHPTHPDTGHDHTVSRSDELDEDAVEVSAVDWADYPVDRTRCSAEQGDIDTAEDGE